MTPTEFKDAVGASDAQMDEVATFRDLVVEWNGRMNLVGPSFLDDFWRRHAMDSAQLFHMEHRASTWADVGAGAGFPGVVLAILLKTRGGRVHLVESSTKRSRFLEMACARLQLPVTVHNCRAENLQPTPKVDVVTARACAPLSRLLDYTAQFLSMGALGMFLKGSQAQVEIADARRKWLIDLETLPSRSSADGKVIRVSRVERRV